MLRNQKSTRRKDSLADTVEETSIQTERKTGTVVEVEGMHSFRRCGRQAQKQQFIRSDDAEIRHSRENPGNMRVFIQKERKAVTVLTGAEEVIL
jgi:hypothetical protein